MKALHLKKEKFYLKRFLIGLKKLFLFQVKNFSALVFAFVFFPAVADVFKAHEFVIASPSPYSAPIIQKISKQGGGAVDMAIAAAFGLAVTHPYYVSLGSGGFALIKINKEKTALDFREVASYKMSSDFFEKNRASSRIGALAAGAPGFTAGMFALHKKYGKLPWRDLIQPALFLAEKGFPVSGDFAAYTKRAEKDFNSKGREVFLKKNRPYRFNEVLKQPDLAAALKLLQKQKSRAFYHGAIGRDIVSSVQKVGGVLSLEDLKKYQVRWLKPLVFSFRGFQIYSMPLPSSGGLILARAFKLAEKQKLYKKKPLSFDEIHLMGEIFSQAFLPRYLMGDPDFSKFNSAKWLSDENLNLSSRRISPQKVLKSPLPKESPETTHFSIIDKKGNTVSMTLTLNAFYGSKFVSSKYGIVLNNQIDDFTTLPEQANLFGLVQGKNNLIEGGKRPLSSMSPTFVEKNGQTILSLGGAGGPTIITGVFQTIYRRLIHKMELDQALYTPRIHHQFLPRKLYLENKRFSPELIINLKMRGHKIEFKDLIARVFAVARTSEGVLLGAGDLRKESHAGGL